MITDDGHLVPSTFSQDQEDEGAQRLAVGVERDGGHAIEHSGANLARLPGGWGGGGAASSTPGAGAWWGVASWLPITKATPDSR